MTKFRTARCMLLAAVVALSACAAQPQSQPDVSSSMIEDGRQIAEAQCARCHAIGEYGDSPNPAAPVFRTLLSRYRADVLEEELIAGIQVTHDMPDFQFNPQGADALVAYLRSAQTPPPPQR